MTVPLEDDYWLNFADKVRVRARAVIFDKSQKHILVEQNPTVIDAFSNFIGGGLKFGETLQECIEREIYEEIGTKPTSVKKLFTIENFFTYDSMKMHGLEQFFEVQLHTENVLPLKPSTHVAWLPLENLMEIDLRPHIVRNAITQGTLGEQSHIVNRGN